MVATVGALSKRSTAEFTSEKAYGEEGYLTDKGLIPMPEAERKMFRANVDSMTNLAL